MNSSCYSSPRRKTRETETFQLSLQINADRAKTKQSLFWCSINLVLFAIIWYDLNYRCRIPSPALLYTEYAFFALFLINSLYHLFYFVKMSQSVSTALRRYDQAVSSLDASNALPTTSNFQWNLSNPSFSTTPLNTTAVSWRSNRSSVTEGRNANLSNSLNVTAESPQFSIRRPHINIGEEVISDENSLTEYLKQYKEFEKSITSTMLEKSNNHNNSFWSHPTVNPQNEELSQFFRKSQYQLSPLTPDIYEPITPPAVQNQNFPLEHCRCSCYSRDGSVAGSPGGKTSPISPMSANSIGTEMWRHFHVDSLTLTQWNANLRLWISQTIVERLVREIDHIDDSLQRQGISDVHVGQVGLERLKSTAQMAPVLQGIPTLWTLIPFLSLTSNQEYLVKRLKELAKGGCMSSFKWNGGSTFNGKEWNESLPTDSAIIMHLFATYMDTQLLPLPSHPDVKPFTGNHFIKYSDRVPVCDTSTLAIHECCEKPPQYSVVVGEEIFNMVKGYNNLFHTILLFLYQVNKRHNGMLGRINFGKAGVNILWVIDS